MAHRSRRAPSPSGNRNLVPAHADRRRGHGPAPECSRAVPTAPIKRHPHRTAGYIATPPPFHSLVLAERKKIVSSPPSPESRPGSRNSRSSGFREMAEPNPQVEEREVVVEQEEEKRRPRLRYLGFVQVAAAQAAVCLAGLYALAKDHAGPLRPGVDAVESVVKGVVGTIYGRFHGVPLDVLAFVDRKVDDTVQQLDRHLPPTLKAASAQACGVARGVPEVARELTTEVQQSGMTGAARAVYGRIEPVAKDIYVRYEPAAEHLAVSTWRSLNNLPLFPQMAQIVVPTVAYWAEKYNKVITSAAEQGYTGPQYLPVIPTERIAKVFGERGAPAASSPETEPLAGAAAETQ